MEQANILHTSKSAANYKWHVMIITMIGTFMAILDSSIVNVSLPRIKASFGANTTDIEWLVTAYMLAFAVFMPLTAWLRDRVGYKILFLSSLGVFTFGSFLCGLAWNLDSLIVSRIIQAFGGGAITPTAMAMITEVFPPGERGKGLGIWGMGIIVGPAIGPTLGGILTDTIGWRSIFMVNIPVGIVAILIGMKLLAKDVPHHSKRRPFDLWGFVFLTIFLIFALLGISKGESDGWTSAFILSCGVISILGLIGFLLVETNTVNRIIDLKLFRHPIFTSTMIMTVVRSIALYGGIFLLPIFIQNIMGYDAITSGLVMLPGSLTMLALMPIIGIISDKVAPRIPAIIGLILLMFSMFMYRNIDVNTSLVNIIIPTIIRSVGMVLLMAPIMTAMMNAIPQKKAGMASSMNSIVQQIGGSIGIAVFATIQAHRSTFHTGLILDTVRYHSSTFAGTIQKIMHRAHDLGLNYARSGIVAQSAIIKKLSIAGLVMSFQDTFFIAGVIIMLSIPIAFLLPARIKPVIPAGSIKNEKMKEIIVLEG